jgi:hypothetical protein
MKHLILLIFLPARILYRVPSSPSRHDNQEIDGEEGDADDNDAAADDTNATAAGVATVDNEDDYATMPTKLKLFPKKPTKKDSATTDAKPPPPPPPPLPRPPSPSMQRTPSQITTTPTESMTMPTGYFASMEQ